MILKFDVCNIVSNVTTAIFFSFLIFLSSPLFYFNCLNPCFYSHYIQCFIFPFTSVSELFTTIIETKVNLKEVPIPVNSGWLDVLL